ncbi:TetR family transcriptional regulator [Marinobacterium nitratireducens]|uniref:TetR family transcriptional regulator n=1 Tax=Marinobacterium nitratireducens TaxID=518897 RepID=A0A918DSH9_9GAMM|nr:TetR/AcrR family transcriptional regulator [Marinobacterium nitratireducens]GGO80565.1 TetR family transcriptional regulator [Marinobacterium nitratireducens]
MQQSDTAGKILQVAAGLFAEQGFAETTMRQITAKAGVNLAAVNYHFGSKERLILAVAEAYIVPLLDDLEQRLEERQSLGDQTIALEELVEMLMRALLSVDGVTPDALAVFTRLLELAYMPSQRELRDFLSERYSRRLQPYLMQLRADSAPMADDEFFWRLHFLLGSVVFTLSNFQTLAVIDQQANDAGAQLERTLHRMVPVLAAGLQARAETTQFCWL